MNMTRMNLNTILHIPKLVIEEEKEIKKDVLQKEEELETQQELVEENISEEDYRLKASSKTIQQQHSFPSILTDINKIAN